MIQLPRQRIYRTMLYLVVQIKFRDIDSAYAYMGICYGKSGDAFYMVENDKMTEDEKKYVDEVSKLEDHCT